MNRPTKPDIQALVFDLDGVIADTDEFHYLSWQRLANEIGIPFTREDNEKLRGLSRRASLECVLSLDGRTTDEDTAQEWMARKNNYFMEHLASMQPGDALPGITSLIDEARSLGLKTAVGSASKNVLPVLSQLDLLDQFDALGDANQIVNTKPAPDVYLWVAGRLNLHPKNIMIFEDSAAGIEAALAGGFWVVGLGSSDIERSHFQLPGLGGVHLDELLTRLEAVIA